MPSLFDDVLVACRPGVSLPQSYCNVITSLLCLGTLRCAYKEQNEIPPDEVLRYGEYAIMNLPAFFNPPIINTNLPDVPLQATLKDGKRLILTPNIFAQHELPNAGEVSENAGWYDIETITTLV